MQLPNRLDQQLKKRTLEHNLRKLRLSSNLIDFCSNDYLGFSRSQKLYDQISQNLSQLKTKLNGATGSRLISGNNELVEKLEDKLALFFKGESALFFNSGYNANQSILSAIPQRGDTIFYDELVHASIKDGLRLSFANRVSFRHNDLDDFQKKLKASKGDVYVVVESIYSMDGDVCPLKKLNEICVKNEAYLIVDEAHSVGVMGDNGQGLCVQEQIENDVFARVYTFGKALGVHGACVVGSELLIQFLVNFARPFIYTTALPDHSVISVSCALDHLTKSKESTKKLYENIAYFKDKISVKDTDLQANDLKMIESNSAIQGVIISDKVAVTNKALRLRESGMDVRPILSPTVKIGTERLRICLHSFNTFKEIDLLINKIVEK